MEPVVGVFASRSSATGAALELRSHGFSSDRVQLLLPPGAHAEDAILTDEAEQPGVGPALGGVVGGAMGASAGLGLGAVVASLLVPGVGAVTAVGLAAAALFGAGGIVGGAAVGEALEEKSREGLPKDEAYLYQHALAQGHSVVFVLPESEEAVKSARRILKSAGAESLDAAREAWWVGIRDTEKVHFDDEAHSDAAEADFRRGFVAALHPEGGGAQRERHGDLADSDAFRKGYERGLLHAAALSDRRREPLREKEGRKPARSAQT